MPTRVAFDPGDPDRIVLAAGFGLVVSDDAGRSFRWACAAAYGADSNRPPPPLAVLEGAVVLGTFAGLVRAGPDLCDFGRVQEPAEVRDVFVPEVVLDPVRPGTVWALVSTGFGADRVVRSDDGARTFAPVGGGFSAVLLERLLVAPSDPSRVYLSGVRPPSAGSARRGFVWRSDDRGAHFEVEEIPLLDGERVPLLVGVDPTRADRVFVRITRGELDERPERLLESDDGGRSFRERLALPRLTAFAVSEDGARLWAAAEGQGLLRAEGQAPFAPIGAREVRCAVAHRGALWLCLDARPDGVALARSDDGGASLTPLLRMDALEALVSCPRCSSTGLSCPGWEEDLRADVQAYVRGEDAGPGRTPIDAGLPAECRPGGGCAVTPGAAPPGVILLALTALGVARSARGARARR